MFDLTISSNDKKWLNAFYPALKIHNENANVVKVAGVLNFSMAFQEGKPYVINPALDYREGIKIQDNYQIRIECKTSEFSDLPQVYETGSRIIKIAQSRNLKPEDLHINPSGSVCLCISLEEAESLPTGFNIPDFFNNLLVPFFYAQSYFEKYNVWPWGQHSHGNLGLFEWYSQKGGTTRQSVEQFLNKLKRYKDWQMIQQLLLPSHEVKGHHKCICGKDDKIRKCHSEILFGIWRLKKDIKKFNIMI